MYIIDDTYFQAPKREVPNLDEADSKSFAELEMFIDDKCRLLFTYFLTPEQITEFEGYLVDGIFPTVTTGIPQKWIDLVNGTTYQKNDVSLVWKGLLFKRGTYKGSLLADYVYSCWLKSQVSYMTGVGDAKANPKGANLVNPSQRYVNTWNEFVMQYQEVWSYSEGWNWFNYNLHPVCYSKNHEVSLIQFLQDNETDYPNDNRKFFEVKNQLGL